MYFTARQLEMLAHLHAALQEHGKAPTLAEIAAHFGFSRVTALQHLRALEKKGALTRPRYQHRSIELHWQPSPERQRDRRLPIAGRLGSGGRLDYVARPADFDPQELIPTERHGHVIKVVGSHLAADGFPDGALLIIEPRSKPHPGELVLATLNDGTTVIRRLERGAIDDALVPLSGGAPDRSNVVPVRRAKLLGVVKAQVVRFGE